MSFHLLGWYESVDPAGADTEIAGLLDERAWVEGDNIRVPALSYIYGAGGYVVGVTTAARRAKIYSPTLNILGLLEIDPLVHGVTDIIYPTAITPWRDYSMSPIKLGYDETMRALVNANPAAAEIQAVFLLMGDGQQPSVPAGPIISLHGVTAAGSGTGAWVGKSVTWSSSLPPGQYGVIGLQIIGAETLAGRLNFRTGEQWRPGVLGQNTSGVVPADYQRAGKMGIWGIFEYTQPPTVDLVQEVATAVNIVMDVVQIRAYT